MVMYNDPAIPAGLTINSRAYLKVITDDLTFLAQAISLLPLDTVAHGSGAAGQRGITLVDGDLLTAKYGRVAFIARPSVGTYELEVGADGIPYWVEVPDAMPPPPPPPATAPSRPASPGLVVDSDTRITATGVAPDDGGSPITSYDWRHRITGSGNSGWVDRSNVQALIQAFSGLDANTEYDFQFRATNNVGDSPRSIIVRATTEATPTTLTAPAFADDTGDAQNWTQDAAITPLTVPAATGNPTPTYAVVGSTPAGITFNTATRVISGAPTAVGSGTIAIRATNSEGSDDWTVTYATAAPTTGDSVMVALTGLQEFTNYIRWPDNVDLGSVFSLDGFAQELNFVDLNNDVPAGRVSLSIVGFNNRFTAEFEATGRIIFEASDGEMLEVQIADADMTETYAWTPTNSAEVVAFVAHVRGLSDQSATLTLSE